MNEVFGQVDRPRSAGSLSEASLCVSMNPTPLYSELFFCSALSCRFVDIGNLGRVEWLACSPEKQQGLCWKCGVASVANLQR
eukprot:2863218-Amphidinium_carterae.1